ncbi:MAG TPA: DUF4331 domain-containing protein [Thermoleophilaceae bacterium]|nr:DUF4331 domain-containing protein [Thermoleophilaceae bacterium]
MKRLSILAALIAAAIAVPISIGSSHREAPNTMLDPSADNTDVYAWTAKDAPGALTIASDWIPGQNPANGPNFFRFDDRARYWIKIDNTGDGKVDVGYLFRFKTKVRNPNSFLYALPGASGYSDPRLNVLQRYSVTRVTYKRRGHRVRTRSRLVARGLPVAPPNIGPKTFPNYQAFVDGATRRLSDGTKVFVGQRDDPFFVDLGATFDAINVRKGTGNQGQGKDDFSGMSTSAVVMQLPERLITRDHRQVSSANARNAVVGVWSTTERKRLGVVRRRHGRQVRAHWVQVSRLGNPLVNEVVIPLGKKDQFNRTTPDRDAQLYGRYVLNPELAAVLNALFHVNAPEHNRTDIVQAVLQGIPGLNQTAGAPGPPAVDTLKVNLGTPPASGAENRFGVIGGDMAGYPNGRRLGDDVVDIDLQVIAGFLKGNRVPLGDGVDRNDKPFLSAFPYLAPPTSGFDSNPTNRFEPAHPPVPAGGS